MSSAKPVVSQCHSLRLFPVSGLQFFYLEGMLAKMRSRKEPYNLNEAPGTLLSSINAGDGVLKKELTCSVVITSPEEAHRLELLRAVPMIATYVDHHGFKRCCGSPEEPLTLSVSGTAGWVDVKLTGYSTRLDYVL